MDLNIYLGKKKNQQQHENFFNQIHFFSLLYGFSQPSSIYYYYRHYSFYYRADENGVKLPKIHLILSKESSLLKDSNLNLSSTKTDEIEKCWQFIYDIYTKHRYTFEQRSSSDQRSINSLNNYFNHLTQAETFEEFMSQYVMHIANETNTISRIAVKSHSPLLPLKNPHHLREYQTTAQSFDKTLNDIVERI
jgi:hypothetical protein